VHVVTHLGESVVFAISGMIPLISFLDSAAGELFMVNVNGSINGAIRPKRPLHD